MQGINWQSGMKILKDVMAWLQTSKDSSITNRNLDSYSVGVLKDSQKVLSSSQTREFRIVAGTHHSPPDYKIKITEGVAYNDAGERIVIPLNELKTFEYNSISKKPEANL